MKTTITFLLISLSSLIGVLGQCDIESNSEKHELEDLEINQLMDMTFYSDSDFESGYILKATDGNVVPVIYQGGIWMGGIDPNNSLRVSAKQYLDFENLLLEPVNLLILDEPTNHLDLRSKDVLKEALLDFDGTLILVSHDRDFLRGLAKKVYEFKNQRVIEHFETIDDFLERNKIESLKEIDLMAG
jgi:hypothetical protein